VHLSPGRQTDRQTDRQTGRQTQPVLLACEGLPGSLWAFLHFVECTLHDRFHALRKRHASYLAKGHASSFRSFRSFSFSFSSVRCRPASVLPINDWNVDPMHGCQIGTQCPILHAKQTKCIPLVSVMACHGTLAPRTLGHGRRSGRSRGSPPHEPRRSVCLGGPCSAWSVRLGGPHSARSVCLGGPHSARCARC
jgi:hypothetical protein